MNNISSLTEQTITLVDADAQHCNLVFTEFALNCAVALLCCSLARRFVPFLRDPRIRESEEDEGKHIFYGNVSSTLRHIRPRIDKPENIIQCFFLERGIFSRIKTVLALSGSRSGGSGNFSSSDKS